MIFSFCSTRSYESVETVSPEIINKMTDQSQGGQRHKAIRSRRRLVTDGAHSQVTGEPSQSAPTSALVLVTVAPEVDTAETDCDYPSSSHLGFGAWCQGAEIWECEVRGELWDGILYLLCATYSIWDLISFACCSIGTMFMFHALYDNFVGTPWHVCSLLLYYVCISGPPEEQLSAGGVAGQQRSCTP